MQGGGKAVGEVGKGNRAGFKLQTCPWFSLKRNFHTLCTSSCTDLLQNFPCQAEINFILEVGETRAVPVSTSRVPAAFILSDCT